METRRSGERLDSRDADQERRLEAREDGTRYETVRVSDLSLKPTFRMELRSEEGERKGWLPFSPKHSVNGNEFLSQLLMGSIALVMMMGNKQEEVAV